MNRYVAGLAVAILLTACVTSSPPSAAENLPAEEIAVEIESLRQGAGVGQRLEGSETVFTPGGHGWVRVADEEDTWRLAAEATARVGDARFDEARFVVREERLVKVELSARAEGKAGADRLRELADALCAPSELERHTPPPLGTPDPEAPEDWDPVIVTTGSCTVVAGSARLLVKEERSRAENLDRINLDLHLRARPPEVHGIAVGAFNQRNHEEAVLRVAEDGPGDAWTQNASPATWYGVVQLSERGSLGNFRDRGPHRVVVGSTPEAARKDDTFLLVLYLPDTFVPPGEIASGRLEVIESVIPIEPGQPIPAEGVLPFRVRLVDLRRTEVWDP